MLVEDLPVRWRDLSGVWRHAVGRAYRPAGLSGRAPLVYAAGYETTAVQIDEVLAMGAVLASPPTPSVDEVWPHPNPLLRGPALDMSVLRAARALPYVDDARVLLTGGSAGGYMTLMLAASTFPLAGAFPSLAPVNLPYQMAVWTFDIGAISALRPDGTTPVMAYPGNRTFQTEIGLAAEVLGGGNDAELWNWSPLAHLGDVTCPVVLWVTTADALVPLPQFGVPLTGEVIAGSPAVYPIDPLVVCGERASIGRRTLLSLLTPEEVTVVTRTVPRSAERLRAGAVDVASTRIDLPRRDRRWLIAVLDEGPPDADSGHYRYAVEVGVDHLLEQCLTEGVAADQLTPRKWARMVAQFHGDPWPSPSLSRPLPEELRAQRRDVVRGIRTFRTVTPEHEERFRDVSQSSPDAALLKACDAPRL